MLYFRLFLTVFTTVIASNFAKSAEFVPVYIWGTNKLAEHEPALHKIREDSFKSTILELANNDPFILVFAERTLSPEDFAQRDAAGRIAYPHLNELRTSTHFSYSPYVQNPIGAVKRLGKPLTEVSIDSLRNNPHVPKENVLIIDLNDARDDEQRFDMLKRHDADIEAIYKSVSKTHENILVLYTAHHTSWIAPIELSHLHRRSLLQSDEDDKPTFTATDHAYFYTSNPINVTDLKDSDKPNSELLGYTVKSSAHENVVTIDVDLTSGKILNSLKFEFLFDDDTYYTLTSFSGFDGNQTFNFSTNGIHARTTFSYHCGTNAYANKTANIVVSIPGFQVQPFLVKLDGNSSKMFGDAYDCVNFTTIPIWSGLFVTVIMLLILSFGITMIMDIRTMDRFDDAKGKTITIANE